MYNGQLNSAELKPFLNNLVKILAKVFSKKDLTFVISGSSPGISVATSDRGQFRVTVFQTLVNL